MEIDLVSQTIRCVEILYSTGCSVLEKNAANVFLQGLESSEDSYQTAIRILQAQDPSKSHFPWTDFLDITIHVKIFAMNLLCQYVFHSWKATPDDSQRQVIQFVESYMLDGVCVIYFSHEFISFRLIFLKVLQLSESTHRYLHHWWLPLGRVSGRIASLWFSEVYDYPFSLTF